MKDGKPQQLVIPAPSNGMAKISSGMDYIPTFAYEGFLA